MSQIDIVNAADEKYVPHTAAMLHSVFANNPDASFAVHFIHKPGMDTGALSALADLCHRHGAAFDARPVERAVLEGLPLAGRFPEQAWYRVVLAELLPDVDRALWLDSDVIVRRSIGDLWDTDLGTTVLAACPNAVLYNFLDVVVNIGVKDRRLYFNTGVLLLDLARMRAENATAGLREAALRHRDWIRFADQDVLNAVYHQNYTRLPLSWNVLTHSFINVPETIRVHGREEFRAAMREPYIVHFTGSAKYKPWYYHCAHPYRDAYLRHRELAGWPPPDVAGRSFKNFLVRNMPLRTRAVWSTLRRGKYEEMWSYLRPW